MFNGLLTRPSWWNNRVTPIVLIVVAALAAFAFLPWWPNPMDPTQLTTGLPSVIAFGWIVFRVLAAVALWHVIARTVMRTNLSEIGVHTSTIPSHNTAYSQIQADHVAALLVNWRIIYAPHGIPGRDAPPAPSYDVPQYIDVTRTHIDWTARALAACAYTLGLAAFVVTVGSL
jgi:hypothetical protein